MALVLEQQHKKSHGIHYTRMIEYLPSTPATLKVVDPAVGDGELLTALVRVCVGRGIATTAEGFDTDADAVIRAKSRLKSLLPNDCVQLAAANFLDQVQKPAKPTLFSCDVLRGSADMIMFGRRRWARSEHAKLSKSSICPVALTSTKLL